MKSLIFIYLFFFIFFFSLTIPVLALEDQEDIIVNNAMCEEQLDICIEEYNVLLESFREGTNCGGPAFYKLADANDALASERDASLVEIEKLRTYRKGFFFMSVLLIISLIFYFRQLKLNNGGKNGRRKK